MCIYGGEFGLEGINLLGISYYQPKYFFTNLFLGKAGGSIDGSIFFFNKENSIKTKIHVKTEYIGRVNDGIKRKYYAKIPSTNRISLGVHLGTSIADYSKLEQRKLYFSLVYSPNEPIKSYGVFGGLTFLEARQMKFKIMKFNKKGSIIRRVNADVIYYYKRVPNSTIINDANINSYSRQIGYRIYYDFKTTMLTKQGNFGFNGLIGFGVNSQFIEFPVFLGLGVGFSFL